MTDNASPLGRIGRYELLTRLGTGGMGEVFLARMTGEAGFQKQVVIKRMLPHLAGNSTFVNRFLDEGRLVVQLRHAGIAQVLDLGSDDGVIFLAMEHVDGRDLRELMRLAKAQGGVPTNVAVGLLVQVLEALDYAHACVSAEGRPLDIVHRDVSPSNVMVSRGGEVKLVDFGIARAADRLGTSVSGAVQGKYGYMSPQQAGGGELDGRSDQWSVGVMAWEIFVGSRPYDGATDLETLDRIRQHEPGSLADAAPSVPAEVVEVIDRMLSKDPEERFDDAGDAARALQAYLIHVETIVGTREIASWFAQCLEVLPPDRRDQPGAALSLDDALRLNLAGGAQQGAGGTVSIAQGAGATPSPGVGGIAPTPTRPPSTSDLRPMSVTDVTTPTGRGRWLAVLVVLNLALLFTVAALVAELTTESATDLETMAVTQVVETAPKPEIAPAPEPVQPSAPAVSPAVVTPAPIPAPPTPESPPAQEVVEESPRTSKPAADEKRKATTRRTTETGKVLFRYFPASATVKIDGVTVSTSSSNRVETRLPVGRHRVVLTHEGQKRTKTFEVKASETTNLATITVGP